MFVLLLLLPLYQAAPQPKPLHVTNVHTHLPRFMPKFTPESFELPQESILPRFLPKFTQQNQESALPKFTPEFFQSAPEQTQESSLPEFTPKSFQAVPQQKQESSLPKFTEKSFEHERPHLSMVGRENHLNRQVNLNRFHYPHPSLVGSEEHVNRQLPNPPIGIQSDDNQVEVQSNDYSDFSKIGNNRDYNGGPGSWGPVSGRLTEIGRPADYQMGDYQILPGPAPGGGRFTEIGNPGDYQTGDYQFLLRPGRFTEIGRPTDYQMGDYQSYDDYTIVLPRNRQGLNHVVPFNRQGLDHVVPFNRQGGGRFTEIYDEYDYDRGPPVPTTNGGYGDSRPPPPGHPVG